MPLSQRLSRAALSVASLSLVFGLTAGCGGNNVNCDLQSCTVTFSRGVDVPEAEVLGVPIKLVSVEGSEVTLDIAGNNIRVPAGGGSDGLTVKEITDQQVIVEIPVSAIT